MAIQDDEQKEIIVGLDEKNASADMTGENIDAFMRTLNAGMRDLTASNTALERDLDGAQDINDQGVADLLEVTIKEAEKEE